MSSQVEMRVRGADCSGQPVHDFLYVLNGSRADKDPALPDFWKNS